MTDKSENSELFQFDEDFSNHENENNESLFSQDEINELLQDAQELKAKDIYNKIAGLSAEVQENVIKSEDYSKQVTDYELQSILNYSDEQRKQDFYSPLEFNQDVNNIKLEEEFKDFLAVPKISGKVKVTTDSKVLPNDIVEEKTEKVEIIDYDIEKSEHHTSVEIGRDENGELEYIVIHCKCGENTMIKFDYDDGTNNLTDVVKVYEKIQPLNLEQVDLKKKE